MSIIKLYSLIRSKTLNMISSYFSEVFQDFASCQFHS